jgi:probable O-glycosylation ligase (exosortase A-associated)
MAISLCRAETEAIQFRSTDRRVRSGRFAFSALLILFFLIYANPGHLLFDQSGDLGIAKAGAAFAMAALGCSWLLYGRKLRLGGWIGVTLFALFGWMAASVGWSIEPDVTRQALGEILKFFVIFFLVCNVVDELPRARTALAAFALASVIPALGALWSYAHGEHLVEGTRASWIGTFGDPNDLAYYLAAGVAAALGARELERSRARRVAWTAAIGLMLVAILFTQSRGGLITIGVVLALYTLRTVKRARTAIPMIAVVVLAAFLAPRATWSRAGTTLAYQEDASARGRIDAWNTGQNVFADRPFVGVGLGAFQFSWAEYAPGDAGPARAPHNTFVQVLAETGLVGVSLFFGALVIGLTCALRAARSPLTATLGWSTFAGLCAFAVASLTLGELYSWPVYILLGLSASLARLVRENPNVVPIREGRPMHAR